ncbi:MAG TPA: protein translocase subunit SecF, partial [Spirochaetia bacterium]|nr:protein translocase subunit SecF [Spirochaetia bacterium]
MEIKREIDFIKKSKITIVISLSFIILGIISFFVKGGFNLGIDFAGGTNLRVKIDSSVQADSEKIRGVLGEGFTITRLGTAEEQEFFISFQKEQNSEEIVKNLKKNFGEEKMTVLSEDTVGPKIGKEFQRMGFWAAVLSLLLLLLYIAFRFEFKFGIAAIVALFHDVLITLGFVSLLGFTFDIPVLAAVLTLLGYSINDTIIIFDRIREESSNLHLDKREYVMVINQAINKTLSRTLLTSFTTISAIIVLIFFGGVDLRAMALVLLIGFITGTYSSVFVA